MKITVKGILINVSKDAESEINRLMTVFSSAKRYGVQIIKVKPQYTSKIGLYKYAHQYGLNVHEAAALVIARRAFKQNEKVPKILKDKLLTEEERIKFQKENNWKQWSIISKKKERW